MNLLPKRIVGIDFHDHSAEVMELCFYKNEVILESYNRTTLPLDILRDGEIKQEAELKPLLLSLLNEANPKPVNTKNVAVILPSTKTFTHIFTFPANLTENEVAKAITYEAETIIPFSIQDVYWDFSVLEKEDAHETHASQYVLFVAIVKKTADQYTQVLESIGLRPSLFATHAESLKFALAKQLDAKKTSLIIDFGTLSTHYMVIKQNTVRYFLSSNKGGMTLIRKIAKEFQMPESMVIDKQEHNKWEPTHEPLIKAFIEERYKEAQAILSEYETNKKIGPVQSIFLTGEFLNIPGCYEIALKVFPNQEVLIGDPKMGLKIEVDKFMPLHKKQGGPVPYSTYFTNAIGIALRGLKLKGATGINILPNYLKEGLSHRRMTFWLVVASIGMAASSLFLATFLFFKHQELAYERLDLEIQKSAIEKTIYGTRYQEIREGILAFNNEVDVLSTIDQGLFSLPGMLETIQGQIPAGITLNALTFNDSSLSVELSGIAESREALLALQQNMELLEMVKEVIAPLSNYDQKTKISFIVKLNLEFTHLPTYAPDTNS